jgi:DNA-3-methyladenine glycosylase
MPDQLQQAFYARDTVVVASELLGKTLIRKEGKTQITGIITETEAYRGEEDLACHCRAGRTPRTEVMYGPAGRAYIYLIYGMYWLLNFVTETPGSPGAVLIRAIVPQEGHDLIAARRGKQSEQNWTNGPGKLCQALSINGSLNGSMLYGTDARIYVEDGLEIDPALIQTGPRVGLESVPEPWRGIPWRFMVNYQHLNI